METAPLFISNFSPQIGIRRWALQCLKHHFLNLWCGKHDLIPVQCFSSDSPSLQIVFVWHHIEGVIVHHCGWWSATSSGKARGKITAGQWIYKIQYSWSYSLITYFCGILFLPLVNCVKMSHPQAQLSLWVCEIPCFWLLGPALSVYNTVVMFFFSGSDSDKADTAVKTTETNGKWLLTNTWRYDQYFNYIFAESNTMLLLHH